MGRKKKCRGARFTEGERVLNFAPRACGENGGVAPEGERSERCQRQMKRGERVAAVKISSVRRKAAWKFWAPQQGSVRIDRRVRLMGAVDV